MIIGLVIGLTIVIAIALFGGLAVGAWLQHDYQIREGKK